MPTDFVVYACFLSLASNQNAEKQLDFAKQCLEKLGKIEFSQIIVNPENQYHLIYHNQMAYLQFEKPFQYQDLLNKTKEIEKQGGRDNLAKPLVALDIDIIAINTDFPEKQLLVDEKGDNFFPISYDSDKQWLGVLRRFPLANYETVGFLQLIQQNQQIIII